MNDFYQAMLNPEIENYIKKRGISTEMKARFELGYAPNNYEIMAHLQRNLINLQEALKQEEEDFKALDELEKKLEEEENDQRLK